MSIDLHPGQSQVFSDMFVEKSAQFSVVVCSRGWGKSFMLATAALTATFELTELASTVPHKVVYIVAPTYDQVTDIYYPILDQELQATKYAMSASKESGKFIFPGNTELRLLSYESIERLRGKGAYFIGGDEISLWKKGQRPETAWNSTMRPCLATRWSEANAKKYGAKNAGRAMFIGTPKGFNFLHKLYNYRDTDNRWKSYSFDYNSSPYIDAAEIDRLKDDMDPVEFASEYGALFKESGNSVFYCFDRAIHVARDLPYFGDDEVVHLCIDFNVGIQATSAFALRGGQMHFLDEFRGSPDTETLAIRAKSKFPNHRIECYPDPTGKSRKTSAAVGVTDFTILESHGIRVNARSSSPPIVESSSAVNRMLLSARGGTNMYFHPRCIGTIESVERTRWAGNNPDLAVIDKSEGIEHFSDGVRYATEFLFPIRRNNTTAIRGTRF